MLYFFWLNTLKDRALDLLMLICFIMHCYGLPQHALETKRGVHRCFVELSCCHNMVSEVGFKLT